MLKSKVSIARKENLKASLYSAIELIDGVSGIKGKKVLIKPNMNSNDPFPATSNPQLLRLLINLLLEQEPVEIIVGDAANASYIPTVESMKQTGLYDAIQDLPIKIIGLEDYEWVTVSPSKASNWKEMVVSAILQDVDFFINQCNIKTHFLANYSMALKNMMGLASHRSRMTMHLSAKPKFWQMIAELTLVRKADLIVLDGAKAMVTGGPFSGEIRETGLVAASNDPVAIDAVGLSILKSLGTTPQVADISPWDQPVLKRAVELQIGATGAQDIEIFSDGVEEIEEIKSYLVEPPETMAA